MMGTRIGVHVQVKTTYIQCWRCGIQMKRPELNHLVQGAPCADCRESIETIDGTPRSTWSARGSRAVAAEVAA